MAKAAVQVDVIPTMQGVERFTKMLLAEGEAARHRVCCGVDPEVKVRALDVNHSNVTEGTTSDRENGEGESGIEEPELAPCIVALLMEKMMDHKVMVEDRGVKGLMRLHQVKRMEVVERTIKDP